MPTPLRDESRALARLKTMLQPTSEPVLTEDEVEELLEQARIAEAWMPNLVVAPGTLIAPTTPNGWLYEASQRDPDGAPGGVTGETEPAWPLDPRWPSWQPQSIGDGTVRFQIARRETIGLWDIKAAAHAGWLAKAAKCAGEYSSSLEGNSFHPEQTLAQCLSMADRFKPMRFA